VPEDSTGGKKWLEINLNDSQKTVLKEAVKQGRRYTDLPLKYMSHVF